jgi:isopenicillin N synthase-like dioxygenase
MIPALDARKLAARETGEMARLRAAAEEIGFMTVSQTALGPDRVRAVMDAYAAFFALPEAEKRKVDMARTGSNRGWGAPRSEQVSAEANPDYKEVFDCGYELPAGHPLAARDLPVYAPNLWPDLPGFRAAVQGYYADALDVAMEVLRAIAAAIGAPDDYFDAAFARPMALLRGNYYPPRPEGAGAQDFGIAAHTDYGCLTLLATDGAPGLEVLGRGGDWVPVAAQPGEFVINFGEMLEMWTAGRVKATLHRVVGTAQERMSVPLFFNPSHDTNVAPPGSGETIVAGEHLTRRFGETYVHLQAGTVRS